MTTSSWDKQNGRVSSYDVQGLGLNYRITDIGSTMGRLQLQRLAQDRQRRRQIVQLYASLLQNIEHIELPFLHRLDDSAYHLVPILLPTTTLRDELQVALKQDGIQSSVHYPPTHLFSFYRERFGTCSLPITEDVASRELSLPIHPNLTDEQIRLVVASIRTFMSSQTAYAF
ncbi:hypothetical protein KDK_58680 [Dictyobacter kobayashii]|uniref:DegT/DnrJ/EryC1/StrS aminotransferase n=1 Tax=Dictyobacter kobayashii TaxID=2014872 RepID=A0A402ASH4_9CHLR|nr:hypothetical protein KDK_58680 [Dictyobacter kobayashii]